jgi:tRNA-dihydrouridine synthase A
MHTNATFSVAPMMDYTDVHQRRLFRMISRRAILYTEMITANALVHTSNPERFLRGGKDEGPQVLQLGGSDPALMAKATKIAMKSGFQHFNINCGCPSPKVAGSGQFGATLMKNAKLVKELRDAVSQQSGVTTSIKCRIGVDNDDSYEFLTDFIGAVTYDYETTDQQVFIHARKALLGKRFSPADNRKIPPLRYDRVHRLAKDFPHLGIILNGGLENIEMCLTELKRSTSKTLQNAFIQEHENVPDDSFVTTMTDQTIHRIGENFDIDKDDSGHAFAGVMVGRAVTEHPFSFSTVDADIYGDAHQNTISRAEVLFRYAKYAKTIEDQQGPRARRSLVKPIFGLFTGEKNAKKFRSNLDTYLRRGNKPKSGDVMPVHDVLLRASECLDSSVLEMTPLQWNLREQDRLNHRNARIAI